MFIYKRLNNAACVKILLSNRIPNYQKNDLQILRCHQHKLLVKFHDFVGSFHLFMYSKRRLKPAFHFRPIDIRLLDMTDHPGGLI